MSATINNFGPFPKARQRAQPLTGDDLRTYARDLRQAASTLEAIAQAQGEGKRRSREAVSSGGPAAILRARSAAQRAGKTLQRLLAQLSEPSGSYDDPDGNGGGGKAS